MKRVKVVHRKTGDVVGETEGAEIPRRGRVLADYRDVPQEQRDRERAHLGLPRPR